VSIADVLITRGWHQGSYQGADGAVCIAGAVHLACGYEIPAEDVSNRPESRIDEIVTLLVGTWSWADWNDAPERTFDEVLRVAKLADELLDASALSPTSGTT